jgi:hypothetical protein
MSDEAVKHYAALSELFMTEQSFDLGRTVKLRIAYAHMFANHMLAYTPAQPGKPSPGPWKATRGGNWHDITAELSIPADGVDGIGNFHEVARAIVLVIRLGINPATYLSAVSNKPFYQHLQAADPGAWVQPEETELRRFPLAVDDGKVNAQRAIWLSESWPTAARLIRHSPEFALAADALAIGQYVHRTSLVLVAIWAALEALFSPSHTELRFRVSALIASYLEPAGEQRRLRAKEISKLYDKRSSAAHGKLTHETDDLLQSFNLLGEVMRKMIDQRRVPSKPELEGVLFGIPESPQ